MQPLGIYGIGLAGGLGLGLEQALRNLQAPELPPTERDGVQGRFASEMPLPALPGARRFSPWLKMSLAAAREAVAGEKLPAPERLGVIGATAYGSLAHTAAFVENMLKKQEAEPQPANFIYSVHNAASTQVALALPARGYNLTITHDGTSFEQALQAASRRLAAGYEDRLLVLGADEYQPYVYAVQKRLGFWRRRQGRMRIPGEGAAAFLVGPAIPGRPKVVGVHLDHAGAWGSAADERARLTQALAAVQLSWEDVSLVLAGTESRDAVTPEVFSAWQKISGREITPYLDATGFFPTAPATALALGAALLSGKSGLKMAKLKKNPHTQAVLLYNRSQVETRSWVILTI